MYTHIKAVFASGFSYKHVLWHVEDSLLMSNYAKILWNHVQRLSDCPLIGRIQSCLRRLQGLCCLTSRPCLVSVKMLDLCWRLRGMDNYMTCYYHETRDIQKMVTNQRELEKGKIFHEKKIHKMDKSWSLVQESVASQFLLISTLTIMLTF